jgi:hypothetical protein
MASIGHGISDAVRNHIPVWVDDALIDVLYAEYQKGGGVLKRDGVSGFRYRIRQSADWVRKSRKTTSTGFERLYHCKTVQKATLVVHSPANDESANAYVFYMDGKAVAGGRTKLKSTHITSAVSTKDKTTVKPTEVAYVKLSDVELRRMNTQLEHGSGLEMLEFEREA